MTIKVRLAKDYKRATHSVNQTKVNKIDWKEVDPDSNSVQNLLDEGILVRKDDDQEPEPDQEEKDSEQEDQEESDEEQEPDQEKESQDEKTFECDKCEKSFDSERGVKAHKAQVH